MFWWVAPLIRLARERTLEEEDCWELEEKQEVKMVMKLFQEQWTRELKEVCCLSTHTLGQCMSIAHFTKCTPFLVWRGKGICLALLTTGLRK